MNIHKALIGLLSILAICAAGCGKKSDRLHIYGTITWKGQPIPSGMVYFTPDAAKGKNGPDGFAIITDGKYDSADAKAKGCTLGPHVVTISGGDGKDPGPYRPYGNSLFSPYIANYDFPKDGGEVNFVVPDNQPLPKQGPPSDE